MTNRIISSPGDSGEKNRGKPATSRNGEAKGSGAGAGGGAAEDYDSDPQGGGGKLRSAPPKR